MSSGPEKAARLEGPEQPPRRVRIEIPFATIVRILVAALLVWVVL